MPTEKQKPLQGWVPLRAAQEFEEMRQRFDDDVARPFH